MRAFHAMKKSLLPALAACLCLMVTGHAQQLSGSNGYSIEPVKFVGEEPSDQAYQKYFANVNGDGSIFSGHTLCWTSAMGIQAITNDVPHELTYVSGINRDSSAAAAVMIGQVSGDYTYQNSTYEAAYWTISGGKMTEHMLGSLGYADFLSNNHDYNGNNFSSAYAVSSDGSTHRRKQFCIGSSSKP